MEINKENQSIPSMLQEGCFDQALAETDYYKTIGELYNRLPGGNSPSLMDLARGSYEMDLANLLANDRPDSDTIGEIISLTVAFHSCWKNSIDGTPTYYGFYADLGDEDIFRSIYGLAFQENFTEEEFSSFKEGVKFWGDNYFKV